MAEEKKEILLLALIIFILTIIIIFRYEIAYSIALNSIPTEYISSEGAIVIEKNLVEMMEIINIKYNSPLFEKMNRISYGLAGVIVVLSIRIKCVWKKFSSAK